MKNRSFFQIILLAVFGSLGVAGILVFAFAVGGGSSTTGIGKVLIWGTLDKSAFDAVLQQAGSSNPDLQQITYVQKNASTYQQDISQALAEGTGPDMFILPSDYAIQDAPEILPIPFSSLSGVQFQQLFAEAADPYLSTSSVLAIPVLVDPLVLYWNRDLFSAAGFAEPPQYWDDVPAMVEKLTQRDQSGQIQTSGIALGTYQNIDNAKDILALLFAQEGIGITSLNAAGTLTETLSNSSGSNLQPAVFALQFYTQFSDPSQAMYSWSGALQDARAAFAAGQTAMYIGYASEASQISQMNPNLDFAIAAVPQFKGSTHIFDMGRAYAFAVPRVSSNQQGAFMAAELLDSATTSAAFSQAFGIPSALRSVLAQPSTGYGTLFNQMALIARIWDDPNPAQTNGVFQSMIESTISGASTPSQAVQEAGGQLGEILDPSNQ